MKAIIPNLIENSAIPLYIQLYNHIKNAILSNEIVYGEKLPSLRNLSNTLGVSVTTVDLAYSQLLVEGYIFSKPQSGYFVDNASQIILNASALSKDDFTVSNNLQNNISSIEADNSLKEENLPFRVDTSCFDFTKWKKCVNKVFTDYPHLLLFESDPQGEVPLRHEISKYLYSFRGVLASPEQIIISAGTQQTSQHLCRILKLLKINNIATETPSYEPVAQVFKNNGFTMSQIPVKSNGIDIELLPVNVPSAVYVSPSNQFPTGAIMPVGRRYEILKWAESNHSYIIEDDYDSELRYFGRPIPPLKSLDNNQRVIYLGSFSSTLFPAAKISYMVLPDKPLSQFMKIKALYSQTCSKTEQLALWLYMSQGQYMSGIKKLRRLYSQKLSLSISSFTEFGRDFVKVHNTNSGITLSLEVHSQASSSVLSELAKSIGLNIIKSPITDDSPSKKKNLFFYYNQVPISQLKDSIKALVDLWRFAI